MRDAEQVLSGKVGTCVDLATLAASCLEQIGLGAVVVFVREHAFCGAWLTPEAFDEVTVFDVARVRNRSQLGELLLFDPTLLATRPPGTLADATGEALRRLANGEEFECCVDVSAARAHRIRPIASRAEPQAPSGPAPSVQAPVPRAVAPGVAFEDPHEQEAPAAAQLSTGERRLARWKKRLLDLSLRNRFLNFRETKKTLPLACPDLASLEDALADGRAFTIHPRPRLMAADGRSEETHRERTGEDAREAYLSEQLAKHRLHALVDERELEKRLVEMYRGARLSVEESGANTLYLALGFLEWREPQNPGRALLAPIVLLPLELQRKSARRGYRIRLTDEEARVNVTLLEKLRADFQLERPELAELPEDDSGIDVPGVLRAWREAIKGLEGWQVLDLATVGLFSFTKFLMWLDLEHHSQDLLSNRTVRYLVEQPDDEPFDEGEGYVPEDEVDDLSPAEIFTPPRRGRFAARCRRGGCAGQELRPRGSARNRQVPDDRQPDRSVLG